MKAGIGSCSSCSSTSAATASIQETPALQVVDQLLSSSSSSSTATNSKSSDSQVTDQQLLQEIQVRHAQDFQTALASSIVLEQPPDGSGIEAVPYEWTHPPKMALQTTQSVLSVKDCRTIRRAAEQLWQSGHSKARFTYQVRYEPMLYSMRLSCVLYNFV